MAHLSTCGSDCPGEPQCSETADVVLGVPYEERRRRHGTMPLDVPCRRPGCGAGAGQTCAGVPFPGYHGERGLDARDARERRLN